MSSRRFTVMATVCALCSSNLAAQEFYGDFYNAIGNVVSVRGTKDLNVYGSIQNFGTIFVVPTRSVWAQNEFQNSGQIEFMGGPCSSVQTFTNSATGTIKGWGAIVSVGGHINNKGVIWSTGGPLILYSGDPTKTGITNTGTLKNGPGTSLTVTFWHPPAPDMSNQGTVEVNAGGAVAFDCNNLSNEPGATVKLCGGTLAARTVIQKAGATLEGFGTVTGNIIIDPNATVVLTGPTNIVGDVTVAKGATLEVRDGTLLVTGKVACDGTIHLRGGRMTAQHGLSGDYNVIRESSMCTNIDFSPDGEVGP